MSTLAETKTYVIFDGKVLSPVEIEVWRRLETQRSCVPQLSKRDVLIRLLTWKVWENCGRSYAMAAVFLTLRRRRRVTRQAVYYTIRAMREAGIFDGLNATTRTHVI
jgi:hypothetical protein